MSSDIYTAASAGLYALRKLEVVSNNLANANTVGFKGQKLVSREQTFEDTLASKLPNMPERAALDHVRTPGVVDIQTSTDFSLGSVTDTGNPLNVSVAKPNQFFVIQTPDGEAYTRAGNFTLNSDGELVTPDGFPVVGEGGPIALPPEGNAKIAANGTVTANNEIVGQLRVVEFADLTKLERTEGTRFRAVDGAAPQTVEAELITNSLEMPNISVVSSMIDLIEANRSFESYTKVARELDSLTEATIRRAGSGGGGGAA